jgi:hypothetical protein
LREGGDLSSERRGGTSAAGSRHCLGAQEVVGLLAERNAGTGQVLDLHPAACGVHKLGRIRNQGICRAIEFAHPTGVFFTTLSLAQFGWGVWVYARPSPPVLYLGAGMSLAVVPVWIASRTSGLPLGPDAWHPEAAGGPNLAATMGEILIALLGLALAAPSSRRRSRIAAWLRAPVMVAMAGALLVLVLGVHAHHH